MSRPISTNDTTVTRPRRRGVEAPQQPAQSAPAIAASGDEAPVLLRLPDLSDQLAGGVATHQTSTVPPMAEAFSSSTIGIDLSGEPAPEPAIEDEDDGQGSSEIRERRRRRRQRQEQAGPPIWSTTSGRITIAGGVVLLGLLAAIVFSPNGAPEDTDGWDTIESDGGDSFVQVSPPTTDTRTENSPWGAAEQVTPASTMPEPEPPAALASATPEPQNAFTAVGSAPVNEEVIDPQEMLRQYQAQSGYAQNADAAYPTQPATATSTGGAYTTQQAQYQAEPVKPYVDETPAAKGDYAAEGSPGTFVATRPEPRSNYNTNTTPQWQTPQQPEQPAANQPYVPPANTPSASRYSSPNAPYVDAMGPQVTNNPHSYR